MPRIAGFSEKLDYRIRDTANALKIHGSYLGGVRIRVAHEKLYGRGYWANNVFLNINGRMEATPDVSRIVSYRVRHSDVRVVYTNRFFCADYAVLDCNLRTKHFRAHPPQSLHLSRELALNEEYHPSRLNPDVLRGQYVEITDYQPEQHYVQPRMVGHFLYGMAKNLQRVIPDDDGQIVFFILTQNHTMTMTLRQKLLGQEGDQPKFEWSVSLYDPNITYNHSKIRFKAIDDFMAMRLTELMPQSSIEHYSKPLPPFIDEHTGKSYAGTIFEVPETWKFSPINPDIVLDPVEYATRPKIESYSATIWDVDDQNCARSRTYTLSAKDYLGF